MLLILVYIVAVAFIVINCVNCEARDDIGMFRESADLRIVCESFLYLACIENNSMTLSILANSFELCSQRGKRKKPKRSRKGRKSEGKEIQFNLFVTEILNSVWLQRRGGNNWETYSHILNKWLHNLSKLRNWLVYGDSYHIEIQMYLSLYCLQLLT